MGKVITFKPRSKTDAQALRMVKVADAIDAIMLENIEADRVDPRDMAALLAHRLGSLIDRIDDKDVIWEFCIRVMRRQAHLDKTS